MNLQVMQDIKEIPSDGKWIVSDIDMADIGYFGGWKQLRRDSSQMAEYLTRYMIN